MLQAIEEIESEQGEKFSLERINLAELKRRMGISRAKLRRLKQNGFAEVPQYFARPKVPADHPDRLHRHSGRYASQRNYQFCGVSGATASRRLSWWLHYGKRLHCILQVFDACKTTAGSPTGKTWLTFHHRARRILPDGLGVYQSSGLRRLRIQCCLLCHGVLCFTRRSGYSFRSSPGRAFCPLPGESSWRR